MSEAQITKRAIAASLKELCRTKPFRKISVADIAQHCGINRQTFYYHFGDKFELLNWIYYEDAFSKTIEGIQLSNWTGRLETLLHTMQEEKWFYTNTIKDQPDHFSHYLFQIGYVLFRNAIDQLDDQNRLTEEQKQFYAAFYTHGISGSILTWAKGGMKESPETFVALSASLVADSAWLAAEHNQLQ